MNEILEASYYENLKFAKELGMYLSKDHPKRKKVLAAINKHIKERDGAKASVK
jgi:hypothetical protein